MQIVTQNLSTSEANRGGSNERSALRLCNYSSYNKPPDKQLIYGLREPLRVRIFRAIALFSPPVGSQAFTSEDRKGLDGWFEPYTVHDVLGAC